MDTEQKAKAYDRALEIAKAWCKLDSNDLSNDDLETLFPELKESEDERIRKGIIRCVIGNMPDSDIRKKYIAWLEKQGEQKIDDDKAILENWEGIVKDNKEKWQLSDWFVEATLLLVQKIKQIGLSKSIIDNNKTMLNACINTLRNVGYPHLAAWLEKQGDKCLVNFDEAEQEKYDFVSGQFIECRKSFNEFKEDNSYWLEYIGDDNYIGRSDNILNQKFHITPRQLFTLFTWQHRPKEDGNVNEETNTSTGYGKYVDECLYEASKHFFSDREDKYSVADLFYAGVRCGKSWLERQDEQKAEENKRNIVGISSNWSEEDDWMKTIIMKVLLGSETFLTPEETNECVDWLKSLKDRTFPQPKQEWSEEDEKKRKRIMHRLSIDGTINNEDLADINEWLKSLRHQSHWKPSDEQMSELENYIGTIPPYEPMFQIFKSLYNDLKKLTEE